MVEENEQMLQEVLPFEIVSTLQEEEKKIIRAPIDKPLLVQGVAGSGKTTLALYRIAYLMHEHKNDFNADNFMIIGQNKFFFNNTLNILHDLGIRDVKQYNFEELANEIIGRKIRLSSEKEKLIIMLNKSLKNKDDEELNLMLKESKFKASMQFKKIIDKYLENLVSKIIPKKDFIIANIRIIKADTVKDLFLSTYSHLSYEERFDEIKKYIFSKIKLNLNMIIKEVVAKRSVDIQKLMKKDLPIKTIRNKKMKIFDKTEKILKMLYKEDINIVDFLYFGGIKLKNARDYYRHLILNFLHDYIDDKELAEYLIESSRQNFVKNEYSFEDLTAILYIHNKVFGAKFSNDLKHLIVDDVQDYGEFQFYVLKDILKSESITIFGDLTQSIYSYRGVENWDKFVQTYFSNSDISIINLNKINRNTQQMLKIANIVINKLPKTKKKSIINPENVIDKPDSVRIIGMKCYDDIAREIARKIRRLNDTGCKSLAIIGRDMKECRSIKKLIGNYITEPILIEKQNTEYREGVCVIPSYIAKGAEFDYVIIPNAGKENYSKNLLDIKLLYIALTRAKTKLDIYFVKNISKLIIE